MPTIMLVDNGSRRAETTLALRRLAHALSERSAKQVHPVSLLHSDLVPAEQLDGSKASTFRPFLQRCIDQGERHFVVVPLFFGPSRAISRCIPEQAAEVSARLSPDAADKQTLVDVVLAEPLCPLPQGEHRLAAILEEGVRKVAPQASEAGQTVVLVDHGSPLPGVTAVRNWLARELQARLSMDTRIHEAAMERRPGARYDFNGPLLEDTLRELACDPTTRDVTLAMLFLAPGRHAGPGGDVEAICTRVQQASPGLRIVPTALVGEHPLLLDILQDRLGQRVSG